MRYYESQNKKRCEVSLYRVYGSFLSVYSDEYAKIMERLAGRVVEVDDRFNFPCSYNIIDPDDTFTVIDVRKLFCEEIEL